MGRVKLKIEKLQNFNGRQVTYCKRKHGIMKKAKELSVLCDIDVVLLMFSPAGKPSLCLGKHSIEEVIAKFGQLTPQERAKRKLENLEALKKTFKKINHDIDISEYLDRSTPTVEVLREKVRFLQTQLSDTHTRLSHWTSIKKINSLDDLEQLEHSLKQSLGQMYARKASMPQYQQRRCMSSECMSSEYKNQLQSEIDIDFGMDMEQELENFSWVRADENIYVPQKEEDPTLQLHQTYRDLTCSSSSSLGSYSGLFGESSTPKLETGSIPGTLADPNLQFSNLNILDDQKLLLLAEWNLLGCPEGYYFSQFLGASYKPQFGRNDWASSETSPYHVPVCDHDPLYFWPNKK